MIVNFQVEVEVSSLLAKTAEKVEIFNDRGYPPQHSGYRIYLKEGTPITIDPVQKDPPDWPCIKCPLWRDLSEADDNKEPQTACWGPFAMDSKSQARISLIEYRSDQFQSSRQGDCGLRVIPGIANNYSNLSVLKIISPHHTISK